MNIVGRLERGKAKLEQHEEVIHVVIAVFTITSFAVKKYQKRKGTFNLDVQENR